MSFSWGFSSNVVKALNDFLLHARENIHDAFGEDSWVHVPVRSRLGREEDSLVPSFSMLWILLQSKTLFPFNFCLIHNNLKKPTMYL